MTTSIFRAERVVTMGDDAPEVLNSASTDEQKRFLDTVLDVDLSVMRPLTELPAQTVEFDRQDKIDAAYQQQGIDDLARGWKPYVPS